MPLEKLYLLEPETIRIRSQPRLLVSELAVLIALNGMGLVSVEGTPLQNKKMEKKVNWDCSGEPVPPRCLGWV